MIPINPIPPIRRIDASYGNNGNNGNNMSDGSNRPCSRLKPLPAVVFGELSEVAFDDFAVVRGEFFGKALQSFLALGGW